MLVTSSILQASQKASGPTIADGNSSMAQVCLRLVKRNRGCFHMSPSEKGYGQWRGNLTIFVTFDGNVVKLLIKRRLLKGKLFALTYIRLGQAAQWDANNLRQWLGFMVNLG